MNRFRLIALVGALLFVLMAAPTDARTLPDHKYPRTAAFFLKTSPFSEDEIQHLADFQVVILDIQTQITNPTVHARLRSANPSIIILGYTSGVEYPLNRLTEIEHPGGMWHQIGSGLHDSWFLRTAQGTHMSAWPGNVLMNPGARAANGTTYAEYLATFLSTSVLSERGRWDGLFFDTVWDGISWISADADMNGDGKRESRDAIDRAWRDGQNLFFRELRKRVGKDMLLVGNGVLEPFASTLNGRMFESFPDASEGGWAGSVTRYRRISDLGQSPHVSIVNRDSDNTGLWSDFRRMRYGLATTLLDDGYYNFDWGAQNRDQLWWYDEYAVSLGKPSSLPPINLLTGRMESTVPGLWMRNFEHGVTLINSTLKEQVWLFEEEFEHIRGTQDPTTNSGEITRSIRLPAESGLLLMRPLDALLGIPYVNGSFVRIFNKDGGSTRNGFFSYEGGVRGGAIVASRDLDGDGQRERIVAEGNRIDIFAANGTRKHQFFPYSGTYRGTIRFALGDIDRNGSVDIVTIPADNAPAHVRLFHADGRPLTGGWFASAPTFRGGGTVAIGNLDGKGDLEILVGAGRGAAPRVRAYHADGTVYGPKDGWLVYAPFIPLGVSVASGDVNGDGMDEIVVGAGRGGGPHVRVFTGDGQLVNSGFFAFAAGRRDGVDVQVVDVDGDGRGEIIAMTTNVFTTADLGTRPPVATMIRSLKE